MTSGSEGGLRKRAGRLTGTSPAAYPTAQDPREIFEIPEVRSYWQQLDQQLPALPALLTHLPDLPYNGPGMHLMLLA
jgi:hypothetical protein